MNKGFTLIETLVAISVLTLSLAGPLSIASNALQSAYYARDELTGFYLAQEGLEYVRAVRDQNLLTGNPWLQGLDGNGGDDCTDGPQCTIDFPLFDHGVCSGTCPFLYVSDNGGLYTQDSSAGAASRFRRVLTISSVSAVQINVQVTVSWNSGTISRSVTLKESLFDWL